MTQAVVDINLLENLVSRICHDLISPVGAIQNGLEFLEDMGPDGLDDARDLLGHSASQAAARLKAFRLAFGAGGRDPNLGFSDVWKAFGEYLGDSSRLSQDWSPMDLSAVLDPVPPGLPKALMAALMIAAECLPKGGVVRVELQGDDTVAISAETQMVLTPPALIAALQGTMPEDGHDAKLITGVMLYLTCQSLGIRLHMHDGTANPLLTLSVPVTPAA